jgi:hypothetical protein
VDEKVQVYSKGEKVTFTEDERAYVSFVLDDPNPKGGLSILSPIDGLYILAHVAGLIINLGIRSESEFIKVLNSKGVYMFTNSLMINENMGMTALIKILASDQTKGDHKLNDYSFRPDFFNISQEGNLVLRKDILAAIRKVYEKNMEKAKEYERRNCPASYASKDTNEYFGMIVREIILQYKKYLSAQVNLD